MKKKTVLNIFTHTYVLPNIQELDNSNLIKIILKEERKKACSPIKGKILGTTNLEEINRTTDENTPDVDCRHTWENM